LKDKKIALPRFCKYVHCKKLLPKDAHSLKKYCKDTECAYRQNQLEAAERRAEQKIQNPKPKKYKLCNFDECKKEFEVPPKSPLQAYCSDECRDEQRRRTQRENHAKNIIPKQIKVAEEVEEKAHRNTKSMYIDTYWLDRGRISSTQTDTMIGANS